jgi:transcription initiation factor IIE alpha subunit
MGQQDVYDHLLVHVGQWFTSKQIADALHISIGSVTMSLKKLRNSNAIAFRTMGARNSFQYSIKVA